MGNTILLGWLVLMSILVMGFGGGLALMVRGQRSALSALVALSRGETSNEVTRRRAAEEALRVGTIKWARQEIEMRQLVATNSALETSLSILVSTLVQEGKVVPSIPVAVPTSPPRVPARLLIVLPPSDLDLDTDFNIVAKQSGAWTYDALRSEDVATRAGLIGAFRRRQRSGGYRAIYIGSHGAPGDVVRLSGGETLDHRWFRTQLPRFGSIQLVVIAACHSAELAGAILDAGARVVILVRGTIEDPIVHRLAAAFWGALGGGARAGDAFSDALGSVPTSTEEQMVFHGDYEWLWDEAGA